MAKTQTQRPPNTQAPKRDMNIVPNHDGTDPLSNALVSRIEVTVKDQKNVPFVNTTVTIYENGTYKNLGITNAQGYVMITVLFDLNRNNSAIKLKVFAGQNPDAATLEYALPKLKSTSADPDRISIKSIRHDKGNKRYEVIVRLQKERGYAIAKVPCILIIEDAGMMTAKFNLNGFATFHIDECHGPTKSNQEIEILACVSGIVGDARDYIIMPPTINKANNKRAAFFLTIMVLLWIICLAVGVDPGWQEKLWIFTFIYSPLTVGYTVLAFREEVFYAFRHAKNSIRRMMGHTAADSRVEKIVEHFEKTKEEKPVKTAAPSTVLGSTLLERIEGPMLAEILVKGVSVLGSRIFSK